jgi:hypothetical protein
LVDDDRLLKHLSRLGHRLFAICLNPSPNVALCPFTLREMVKALRQMDARDIQAQGQAELPLGSPSKDGDDLKPAAPTPYSCPQSE